MIEVEINDLREAMGWNDYTYSHLLDEFVNEKGHKYMFLRWALQKARAEMDAWDHDQSLFWVEGPNGDGFLIVDMNQAGAIDEFQSWHPEVDSHFITVRKIV